LRSWGVTLDKKGAEEKIKNVTKDQGDDVASGI